MTRRWPYLLAGPAVVAAALGVAVPVLTGRSAPPVVPSPDGRRTLVTGLSDGLVTLDVVGQGGRAEFRRKTGASDRMRWSARWDGNDGVVLESGDIGTFVWRRGADGHWSRERPDPTIEVDWDDRQREQAKPQPQAQRGS